MKKLLTNKVFLISVIMILLLLNIFCHIYTKTHSAIECPIYILYTNNSTKENTQHAEKMFEEMQKFTDIPGDRSYLLLTPDSPKYNRLVSAYNLTNKTNAMITIDQKNGKVLSYKVPIPQIDEIEKIMKAISNQ